METATGAGMAEENLAETLRRRWSSVVGIFSDPPLDSAIFRSRLRFVERHIGIWVKAVLGPALLWFLFSPSAFSSLTAPREDVLHYLRNYALIMIAVTVGYGIVLWGMDELSTRFLERVVYIVAVLDLAFLAAVTLFCGGFDSILYWVFLGLVVRNAAVIPNPEVQILVNLTGCACYVLSGVLDLALTRIENVVLESYSGKAAAEGGAEVAAEPLESLALRVLLLLLMTVVCLGLQVLLDRQRQRESEAREFALKQEQLEAAGRLAAEIAHQLKNPLGIINNAAYTLHKTVKEGKTITQQIAIIREEVARSDRIITDLMGYARLAEGRVERVPLASVLEEAVAVALPSGSGFRIQLHRDMMEPLPSLLGQRGHFLEIFANLLVNAREAMNGVGEIWISAKATPDYSAQITIRDSGPGIAPDQLGRIWEAYYTTKDRGTGLGLAIVKHNAEMYGGRVRVESEPGKGAAFVINLPARTLMRLQ